MTQTVATSPGRLRSGVEAVEGGTEYEPAVGGAAAERGEPG
ncbi:hypothetical protein SCALM49S_05306 [Streptomyces californicus]